MRLLRLADVEIGSNDQVFRHPRLPALILWLGGFAAVAAMFFNAYTGKFKPGYIFGPFVLLFLLLTLKFVTARFHPSNWLARTNQTGIYVQYRSYLNYRLPADDPSVVFISYGEIASARRVRERSKPRTRCDELYANAISAVYRTGIDRRHHGPGLRFGLGAIGTSSDGKASSTGAARLFIATIRSP